MLVLLFLTAAPALAQTFPGKIGLELDGPNEGARNRAYVDIARGHRPFYLNDGSGVTPKDSLGWPTTDGNTVLFDIRPVAAWLGVDQIDDPDRFVPDFSGTYKCSFTGQADLVVREGNFTITNKLYNSSTNTTTFDLNVPAPSTTNMANNIVVLQFNNTRRTSGSALNTGLTNLKAIRPGYHATPNQLFTNEFVNSLAPFQYLRLMDWVETNANPGYYGDVGNHKINWAARKKPDAATQQYLGGDAHGACWEHALLLCNQTNKDIWVNIPVNATDEYITGLANLLKNGNSYTGNVGLNSNLKIYVEHSNEVWNFSFPQYTYNKLAAVDEATNDPNSPLDNDGTTDQEVLARRRHAKRTRDAVKIFESVFGANTINSKIFGIYSHWTIFPDQYNATLSWMNATYGAPSSYFYAMGQTLYFNDDAASSTATVTEILTAMRNNSDGHVSMTQSLKNVANTWGIQLVAYEAGPDTGGGSTTNVANRIRAERDPEMKNLIERNARTNWFPNGGDLYTQFAHAGGYSRYGCWGATEDALNINTYKYQAIYSLTGYGGANQVAAPGFSPLPGTYSTSQSVTISTTTSGASIRYTTNGTDPTSTTGTLYSGPVSISATTTLKAIAYKSGMTDSTVSTGVYTIGSTLRNPENPANTVAGLDRKYYTGSWSVLPNFDSLTPARTDTSANFSLTPNDADNYGYQFTGYVDAPSDGTYTFYTASDDGSKLYIGTTEVVNNDGLHAVVEQSGSIGLKAGKHALKVTFFENTGGDSLTVSWSGPGIAKQAIPDARLFRVSGSTTGSISQEIWTGISGTAVSDIPLTTTPNQTGTLTSFEAATNWGDNYGQRVRGYLTAPQTGSYTFWIAADDGCELWLSTNDQAANKTRIAYHTSWTNSREWNKFTTQKSSAISLTGGQRYYIEALMKEGGGGDNLAVGWAKPGQSTTAPSEVIPGAQLSPWDGGSVQPPAAPTNLAATAGDGQVGLTWSASSGATSYKIFYTTGGNFSQAGTSSTTSFTHTNLTNGVLHTYYVTAVNSGGESGPSNQASATPQAASGLPSGWTAIDIGGPTPTGSTSHSSGTWTVRGGGADIWGTSDQFHYAYRDASGDTTVIARVDSITNTNGWAKGGVMIRDGTAANAMFAMAVVTPTNGVRFQYRTTTGGSAVDAGTTGAAPKWVRLIRSGNNFTASWSDNGTSWTTIGSTVAISMPTATKAGLCLTSHAQGTLCTAGMSNVSVTAGGGSAPPTPTGLSATAGNGQVALSWNASSGATSYNVKRSTTSGSGYSTINSPTTTSYTNTGLTNGVTYYYVVSAVNSNGESANSSQVSATPTAPSGVLLASEPFAYSTGALHNLNGGTGWGAAWFMQNNDLSVPGYNVASTSPPSFSTLSRSGNYAIGGDSYQTVGRALDVTTGGSFGTNGYLSSGLIGASGKTLWMSVLLRKDVNNDEEAWVMQHPDNTAWNAGAAPRVGVGYFGSASNTGSTRYWSVKVGTAVTKSNVALTVGQTSLLVVKVTFGATTTVDLYVNPSSLGGSAPSTANASTSTTSTMTFKNVAFYGGNGFNGGSLDEIRLGTTYGSVTP